MEGHLNVQKLCKVRSGCSENTLRVSNQIRICALKRAVTADVTLWCHKCTVTTLSQALQLKYWQSWCENMAGDACSGLWELTNQSTLGLSERSDRRWIGVNYKICSTSNNELNIGQNCLNRKFFLRSLRLKQNLIFWFWSWNALCYNFQWHILLWTVSQTGTLIILLLSPTKCYNKFVICSNEFDVSTFVGYF